MCVEELQHGDVCHFRMVGIQMICSKQMKRNLMYRQNTMIA